MDYFDHLVKLTKAHAKQTVAAYREQQAREAEQKKVLESLPETATKH